MKLGHCAGAMVAALCGFVTLLASGAGASAQSFIPMTVAPKSTAGQLLDGNLYAVDIVCSKPANVDLADAIDRNPFFTNTRTHALFVSTQPVTAAPDGQKLPEGTLAGVQVFSVDKGTTFVDRRDCEHHFIIAGGKRYYLIGAINILDDFANSTAGTVLTNLTTLVTPLFSLFTGNPIPAMLAGKLTNLQSLQVPLQNILTALNKGKNMTRVVDNLKVGTYTVTTKFSTVTVTIRQVPSLVLDQQTAFRADFRKQISDAPDKIDAANIDSSCRGVRTGLTESSFTSRTDIAYALIALGAKAKFTKEQVITCLTWDYVKDAIAMPDAAWISFPVELRFTQADAENVLPLPLVPPQPSFAVIRPKLDLLVISLAQYARNKRPAQDGQPEQAPPQVSVNNLTALMAEKLSIVDKTMDVLISGSAGPMDRFAAVDLLWKKGYLRFGCYAETTEATDRLVDGAVVMFLAFNAKSDAPSTTVDKALVIRPIYTGLKVTSLIVSVNKAFTTSVLTPRDYDCNGFVVEKPKPAPPVG